MGKKGTLDQIIEHGHTHCVLEYDGDIRSLRIVSDRDLYEVIDEETVPLGSLCMFSGDAADIVQGVSEEIDEDEPVRVIHALWEGEDVTIFIPDSW